MVTRTANQQEAHQWLQNHGDAMFRYALSMVHDVTAAEEVVQDSLVAALRSKNSFQGRSAPQTWLLGIVRHKVLDYFRDQARQRSRRSERDLDQEDALFDSNGGWVTPPGAIPEDPHQILSRVEFQQILRQCLDRLPEPKRAAILLRVFEELSGEEICKQLDITTTYLWVLLHRARTQLRRCLDENWFQGSSNKA